MNIKKYIDIIPELTYIVEMAEKSYTKSSIKLGGFRSQLEASACLVTQKSCDTTEESVCER